MSIRSEATKMKCPFCGSELQLDLVVDKKYVDIYVCPKCGWFRTKKWCYGCNHIKDYRRHNKNAKPYVSKNRTQKPSIPINWNGKSVKIENYSWRR